MQPTLAFFLCLLGTVVARYHDKTRFDRSIPPVLIEEIASRKQWSFTDDETKFVAYKDRHENNCYLENLKGDRPVDPKNPKPTNNVLYAPTQALTKIEAWRIAGGRIVDFCKGRNIVLLQESKPVPDAIVDPFDNELPIDENDILTRRVSDVVLTPLLSRAKRQVMLEERERLNQEVALNRRRRQAPPFRGHFRGQTQSQYLNTDGSTEKDGKAEAEASQQSSHAVVSGSRGMGQAQSMSMGGTGCEDCPGSAGYLRGEGALDRVRAQEALRGDGRYSFVPGMSGPGQSRMMHSTGGAYYPKAQGTGVRAPQEMPAIPGTVGSGNLQPQPDMVPSGLTRPGTISTGAGQGQGTSVPETPGREGARYPDFPRAYPGRPGENLMYPGGTAGVMPGSSMYPGGSSGSQVRGNQIHPGMSQGPSTSGIAPGAGTYPLATGALTPEGKLAYPGGSTNLDRRYPSGGIPRTPTTYPGGMPPGGVETYPGAIVPGSGGYPGGVSPDSGLVYYGNIQPGMARPGSPVDTFQQTRAEDRPSTYPRGVPGTIGTGVVYPESQPTGNNLMPGREQVGYPGVYQPGTIAPNPPGSLMPGQAYPSGIPTGTIQSGVPGTYPDAGGSVPGAMPDSGVHTGPAPGGISPSGTLPGGIYPSGTMSGTLQPGRYQETLQPGGIVQGHYPGTTVPGTVPLGTGNLGTSTGTIPARTGTNIPGDATYPGGLQPGTIGTLPGNVYPGGPQGVGGYPDSGSVLSYPGTMPNVGLTSQPGTFPQTGVDQGRRVYPGNIGVDNRGQQVAYPAQGGGQVGQYDGTQMHGGTDGTYPGRPTAKYTPQYQTQPGIYPSGIYTTDMNGNVQPADANRQQVAQYPTGGIAPGREVGTGQYPLQHPGGLGVSGATDEASQYYRQQEGGSSVVAEGEDANADSQASSSVKQVDSGTQASASAQGVYGKGTAQSQVTGTYSGSGSFMAQAGTSDVNKSAQTEISGGKEGAISNAQGVGGYGKSQVQVQLDSESGATSTGAQSSGWNHGTNSQVQASSKGGMADAQANGEGNTSSQAQIGFRPYVKTDENVERQSKPFRGGGSASAQSGTYRGQSQSLLEGSFQYGITYTGAAQAGSGSGAAASRKPFNFNLTDTEAFKPFKPYNTPVISKDVESATATGKPVPEPERNQDDLQGSSTSQKAFAGNQEKPNSQNHKKPQTSGKPRMDESVYDTNTDYDDEYDEEYYDSPGQPSANSKISAAPVREQHNNQDQQQSQMMHINTNKRYNIRVKQDSTESREDRILQPGESGPGYRVPSGFRGRVTSISGKETLAHGDGKSQSQTVTLIPTGSNNARETKSPIADTRSLQTTHEKLENHQRKEKRLGTSARNLVSHADESKAGDLPISPSYYTFSNSVAGKMDGHNAPRKYEHRYYTKSSTCGYFTFSCNIVYGSEGRKKICKPKVPTYPDGTPMKC